MPHLQETEERKHKSQVNLRTNQNHAVLQFKEPVQVTILGRILKSGFIFVESLPYNLLVSLIDHRFFTHIIYVT